MLGIPEINEIWDRIQQNKKDFLRQLERWIEDAKSAINASAKDYKHNDFLPEQVDTISMGILAMAFKNGLDATDEKQRLIATNSLLENVSWKGTTPYMSDLSATRTQQLCMEMKVTKEVMSSLFLMAGGKAGISIGGGGSNSELTNWDGTKKRNGWGWLIVIPLLNHRDFLVSCRD